MSSEFWECSACGARMLGENMILEDRGPQHPCAEICIICSGTFWDEFRGTVLQNCEEPLLYDGFNIGDEGIPD